MEERVKVKDKSGDRDYFTMVPNYVINHSTLQEQGLYLYLKRRAGEKGSLWESPATIGKKTGVSAKLIRKILAQLVGRRWINPIGKRGKTKPTTEYEIVDLWRVNSDFYHRKESSPGEQSKKKVPPGTLESSPGETSKEPIEEKPITTIAVPSAAGTIQEIFEAFYKTINPTINFGNKTQRAAAEEMIKKFGAEKAVKIAEYAASIQGRQFAPTITTPYELKEKLGKLMVYGKQQKSRQPTVAKIR